MVSSIGENNNILSSVYPPNTRSKPSPEDKFNEFDTDGDGNLSATELAVMTEEVVSLTGQTINVDEAITTYDADGNSLLNQSEMDTMTSDKTAKLEPPPNMKDKSTMANVLAAYLEESEEDAIHTWKRVI